MSETVIVGIGQLGGVFAKGLLRMGETVVPVVRGQSLTEVAERHATPRAVLVAVGEGDLGDVLSEFPPSWRGDVALLQNELLPSDWESKGIETATMAIVWFEKKAARVIREIRPTVVGGAHAEHFAQALGELGLSTQVVTTDAELRHEMVVKNLYILVSNICGLRVGGTVGILWSEHRDLAERVAHEVLSVQAARLSGAAINSERAIAEMGEAFLADPEHGCMGRSAPSRLNRLLAQGAESGLELPLVNQIAQERSAVDLGEALG